jgi:DNA-binding MarR family transcriptional regulator
MPVDETTATLAATLEDLVVLFRRLPVVPTLSLNAASALRACAVEGPQRISALADRLGVSQPGVTQLVDRMAADGYVERVPDPTDGRVVLVRATAPGAERIEHRRASRAGLLDAMLDRLDPADRDRLMAALPALHRLTTLTP